MVSLEELYKAACWKHAEAQQPWVHDSVLYWQGAANSLGMALRAKGLNDRQLQEMEDEGISLGRQGRWQHSLDKVDGPDGTVPHDD